MSRQSYDRGCRKKIDERNADGPDEVVGTLLRKAELTINYRSFTRSSTSGVRMATKLFAGNGVLYQDVDKVADPFLIDAALGCIRKMRFPLSDAVRSKG